jgi:predicted O-methyltransferase YrrM
MTDGYRFHGPDWFSRNLIAFSTSLACFRGRPSVHGLEIGSFEGRSAVWLLENILTDSSSRLTCVDTFNGQEGLTNPNFVRGAFQRFRHNISKTGRGSQVTTLIGSSQIELRHCTSAFDFVYVDGSHYAPDVLEDAVLTFRLLNVGGVMIFDDYAWNHARLTLPPGPAIDAFVKLYCERIEIIHMSYQLHLRKTKD